MIAIVNYGSGNIRAIGNIFDRCNIAYKVVEKREGFSSEITKLILPGVGAFDETMGMLKESGFIEPLNELVLIKKLPILGICVGMQIMSNHSEEGVLDGLGWIPGSVKKFDKEFIPYDTKLPHLGWNSINLTRESAIAKNLDLDIGFYFVHSYYYDCIDEKDVLAFSSYGLKFASAINRENIYGMQFHPEKSHQNGTKLLLNFAKL
ncbi:MAG: imidazole glycerol phosphate synthase subunit HisH [Cyclobacteriaceae bacterium]